MKYLGKYEIETGHCEMSEFKKYVFSFYGPQGLSQHLFDEPVTKEEISKAIEIRLSDETPFYGDSSDREWVRDIMLAMRGKQTEHNVQTFLANFIKKEVAV